MGNRERVIAEIDRLRPIKPGAHRAASLEDFIEKMNDRSAHRLERNPWVLVSTLVFLIPIMLVFGRTGRVAKGLPIWLGYLVIVGGLFSASWVWIYLRNRLGLRRVDIGAMCQICGYRLDGCASVLGNDVWVGPEVCPECDERYPAIG